MAKFLLGLFAGVALVVLGIGLFVWLLLRFESRPPGIADNSVLALRLEGDIPEKAPLELPALFGQGGPGLTIANVWMALRKAAADPRIKAVLLEPEGLSLGWARLEEIRADVERFRKSGKPVVAYLREPGAREYYVALAADRIYLGPAEPLMLKGLRAESISFKGTLDKIGVSVEVEHAGKYKDFGDMFTRADMSPETREVLNSVVDDLYGNLVARIAEARKKSPEEVRDIIDRGPFTAAQALQAGLVDELRFEDEVWTAMSSRLGGAPKKVSIGAYAGVPAGSVGLQGKSRIALVVAEGDIVRGDSNDSGSGETTLTSYGFDKVLSRVANDSGIKGAIVRIDSPGGEVTASDEIWRQMNLLSKKKPTVVSMSDVAASGGYYMAMTGDPIVAYPGTLTGSIGVVYGKPNLHGLYDKLGVTQNSIERGKHADIDSDYTPLSPEERAILRQGIDESYRDFVAKVAAARHRKFDDIEPLAQGRVWLGSQAAARGLVDQLGGLDAALDLVKKKAGIPAGERVTVEAYPEPTSILDLLMRRSSPQDLLQARLASLFGGMPFHAWMKGGYLRLMPYWVDAR
jgi:protease-4